MFSNREKEVLLVLGRRKMSITQIADEIYEDADIESNNAVAGSIRRIIRKCRKNGLKWTIKGEGAGRRGRTVWKEKLK